MTEYTVIWEGLVSGIYYGLVGLAYLLILRATKTYNFSVGAFTGFGSVAFAFWSANFPLPVAFIFAAAATALLAVALDMCVTRPIEKREVGGHFGVVLSLTAALFVIIQFTRQLFSAQTFLGVPLSEGSVSIGGTVIATHSLLSVAIGLGLTAGIEYWQTYGRRGRLLSAIGDNPEAAQLLGLPVGGIRLLAVTIGGVVCAVAGTLIAGGAPVNFYSSFNFALTGFLALVIGGTRSSWGPLIGGCVVGLTETIGARIVGASVREFLLLLVILVVFRIRPQGILSRTVRE